MRCRLLLGLLLTASLLFTSCGGGNYTGAPDPGANLGELDYNLSVDPGSPVAASDVDGELVAVADALNAHTTSALPSNITGRQGMHFTPHLAPGAGFSGRLTVRITMGSPAAGEYEGVLLYLYYIDPVTHAATMINTGRGDENNRVGFNINCLGYFLVAENNTIARPGGFTISAFADLASAPIGTTVNYWAVPYNGTAPYTLNWDFGDGSQASGTEVSHAYSAAGTYNVQLTATDAAGHQAPAVSTPIEITAGPPGPLEIDSIAVTPDPNNHLHFTYSVTLSGGTGPFTYDWTFDTANPGVTSQGSAVETFTFATEGLYFGEVTIGDSTGASVAGSYVSDARSIVLNASPSSGSTPLEVEFTAEPLGFGANDVITIDYGDGNQETPPGIVWSHTYTVSGLYQAQVSSYRTGADEAYPYSSNIVTITVADGPFSTFIQLTQPIVPDPDEPFDIVGYGFGEAVANRSVTVAGFTIDVLSWSKNLIQVQLPDGIRPTSGAVRIEVNGKPASNHITAVFSDKTIPTWIQGVIPPVAQADSRVLITGHGFPASLSVAVAGQPALVERINPNGIVAVLPGGLEDGSYELRVDTGVSSYTFPIAIVAAATGDIPQLDSATPSLQEIGQGDVVLEGLHFGNMFTAIAFAQGYALPRSTHNSKLITLTSPVPSIDSWVCVINRKFVSNAVDLAFLHRPQITALSTVEAAIGETIAITGTHFGTQEANDQVRLGQLALTVLSWTDTLIQVEIPQGAENGQIAVVKRLTSNAMDFRVLPDPPGTPGSGQL